MKGRGSLTENAVFEQKPQGRRPRSLVGGWEEHSGAGSCECRPTSGGLQGADDRRTVRPVWGKGAGRSSEPSPEGGKRTRSCRAHSGLSLSSEMIRNVMGGSEHKVDMI